MKSLSTILTALMAEREIKSAALARKTGVPQPVIYRLMTGGTENPQILTLVPLANFFNVSLEQLIGLAPLHKKAFNASTMHTINSKLSAIKTIASVLTDLLPHLIEGYQKALSASLINEFISTDILPLLPLNAENLLKNSNQIQELLIEKQ
jgi:transcriptional regulator with XRE-family HTH domain